MKIKIIFFLSCLYYTQNVLTEWTNINLPHFYSYPAENSYQYLPENKIYSISFPTKPKDWFLEPNCSKLLNKDVYRTTSTRYISNAIDNISGISFKGLVYKQNLGTRPNEFAFFYHQNECYDGGPEYGWVWPESDKRAYFYLCGNCNLKNQHWCQWPGDCKAIGNCDAIAKALENPAKYQYWNIKVLENGNFLIELVDPVTWQYVSCQIQKPDWLPNLYKAKGYISINAQKLADQTVQPTPVMHIDEVKIWQ